MVKRQQLTGLRKSMSTAVLAGAFVMLIVSAAGAAERVVLGEYFTNQF